MTDIEETPRANDRDQTREESTAGGSTSPQAEPSDPSPETDAAREQEPEAPAEPSKEEPSPDQAPAGWYSDPTLPGQQRYWDGSQWTANTSAQGAVLSTTRRTDDERKAMLAQQLQMAAARGLRVESQSDFQAILVEGKPVNHTLHAILTIFTCLIWGIVWAIIAGTGGERREMIVVDVFGNVQHQKLGKV